MQLPKSELKNKSNPKMKTPKKNTMVATEASDTTQNVKSPKNNNKKKNKENKTQIEETIPTVEETTPTVVPPTESSSKKKRNKKINKSVTAKEEVAAPESPTPEEDQSPNGKKRQNKETIPNPNKKQKMDASNSKPMNTENGNTDGSNQELKSTELQVYFPPGAKSYKEVLEKVIENSDFIRNPRAIYLKYNSPEEAKKRLEVLQALEIDGKKLTVSILNEDREPLKRTVSLRPNGADTESVKEYFGADSIGQLVSRGRPLSIHVLTFKSNEAAKEAEKNSFDIDGRTVTLRPFFKREGTAVVDSDESGNKKKNQDQKKPKPQPEKMEVEEEEEEDDDEEDGDDEEEGDDEEGDDDDEGDDNEEGDDDDDDEE